MTGQDITLSTPLHMASFIVNAPIVQLLIEHGADVTVKNENHSTPLHLASSLVSARNAPRLICCRTDMNGQDDRCRGVGLPESERFILKAETVRLLIKHGADVTARDEAHLTPLHLASSQASTETVRLLIEHGANVSARDRSRRTPLHLASSCVSNTTTSLLI